MKISEYIQETETPNVLFCQLTGIYVRLSLPMEHCLEIIWISDLNPDFFFLFGHMILHWPMVYIYSYSWGFDSIFKQEPLLFFSSFISTLYCLWYFSSMLAHIHHLSALFAAPITFDFHLTCCMNQHKNYCCRGQLWAINIFCSGPGNGTFGSMWRSFCLVQWNARVWK